MKEPASREDLERFFKAVHCRTEEGREYYENHIKEQPSPYKGCLVKIPGTDKIRITQKGIDQLKTSFAQVGIDIHQITTVVQWANATHAVMQHNLKKIIRDSDKPKEMEMLFKHLL